MGSANCKESKNASCRNDGAPPGSYQTKSDGDIMTNEYSDPVLLCQEKDLEENEMRTFDFNENLKVLLVKQRGRLSAISNKCSHYGAPLHNGALGDGRVRCPWHGACFNIETGDIEDFPGLDSVPCFKVDITKAGGVLVSVKSKHQNNAHRLKAMSKHSEQTDSTFVVVGGGVSGGTCVETLRQEGYTGRIVMLSRENNLPYDRVKLSKTLDIEIEKIQFRPAEFYEEYGIETMLGVEATKLDSVNKTIQCSNGLNIKYDRIYIATGCSPAKPDIPGNDLKNVCTLRDHADAAAIIKEAAAELDVVCLGSSFIALEVAAALVSKVRKVTVVGRSEYPLAESLGEKVGKRVLELFTSKGVDMVMESGIEQIVGPDGKVTEVVLKDQTRIPCDLLVMGTGSRFNTEFLKGSRLIMNPNGSIDTDMYLMTNVPDVYVGGDIANAPVHAHNNQRATIGHYQLAQYHGFIAGCNMAGTIKPLHAVPFFFTMLFGKGIRYSGYGKYVDVFIDGSLEEMKFVAYYLDANEKVVAVATCGRDPVASHFAELLSQGKTLHVSEIRDVEDPMAWTKKINASCAH